MNKKNAFIVGRKGQRKMAPIMEFKILGVTTAIASF